MYPKNHIPLAGYVRTQDSDLRNSKCLRCWREFVRKLSQCLHSAWLVVSVVSSWH
jgi:hypothetical protein